MPEGPEIRLAADRVASVIERKGPLEVWFAFPELKLFEPLLSGREVQSVETRGKALLLRFPDGLNVYSHNQLYGKWYVTKPGVSPNTKRTLRLALRGKAGSALLYSASEIEVLQDDQLEEHRYLAKLGPDVLDSDVRPADVTARMRERRFSGRSLGALLLDQGFLCGIGNYLRSEILFVAGLDPACRPRDLDAAARLRLARAALKISRRAYDTRGITADDKLVRRLKAEGLSRRRYRHFVFTRGGQPCYTCGSAIESITSAGRNLQRCPGCQAV
ncbi:hypothetical protein ABI59_01000 [Acidobacteria bacterium Mor1]|nr:hypothetical protein ABI59_01000 [Acidobacteria bacterium Mor1]